jgi:hypothetical protein
MALEMIEAYSTKDKKKLPLTESVEFRKSPNGSFMIKGKNGDKVLVTMMGKVKAQEYIDNGATVVEKFSY